MQENSYEAFVSALDEQGLLLRIGMFPEYALKIFGFYFNKGDLYFEANFKTMLLVLNCARGNWKDGGRIILEAVTDQRKVENFNGPNGRVLYFNNRSGYNSRYWSSLISFKSMLESEVGASYPFYD